MTNKEKLSKALNEEVKRQSESLRINFDKAIEEEKERSIVIEWQGKEYKVPDRAPEWLRLMILSSNGIISDDDNVDIFRRLFGDEFTDYLENEIESNNFVNFQMANEKLIAPLIERWFGMKATDTTKKKKMQG
jgi:hypothetical protein